jgi:two-component system cell cycle response regulator DivK
MKLKDWTVVVVEDEADSMELVQEILEHHDIRTIPAIDAEKALGILREVVPTLVIIDLSLPGMDGWQLLRTVQRDRALYGVPRVAITAYHTAEVASEAIEAGFDAYFSKPLDATSFVRELQGIVEDRDY